MKTKIICLFACALSMAHAIVINGSIGFTGSYTSNNPDLTLATSIAFAPGAVLTNGVADGSFSGIPNGTPVTMFSPLIVNQPGVILPSSPIWSVGGFTLTLASLGEDFNTAQTLNLSGLGILSDGNPLNNSVGDWVATFNRSGTNFTFSASSSAVPEGGSTALLLGLIMILFAATRRHWPATRFPALA